MKRPKDDERAAERFQIIAPLLDKDLDKDAVLALRRKLAVQYGLDERTLRRWVQDYREKGFEGLKPAGRTAPRNRVVTDEILNTAIHLRRELPKRSVKNIIRSMEAMGIVKEGELKRSTLQDALAAAGYSSSQMRLYEETTGERYSHRFQKAHRNDCWQADIKYGPKISGSPTYLFTVIDDATRYACFSGFFARQDLEAAMASMRAAFEKAGIPRVLYLDNGKVFRSKQMERVAAVLGIRLTYIRPYTPRGHGKIERYNRTVEGFLLEAGLENIQDLDTLNHLYEAWIEESYQREQHSALDGKSPMQAFEEDPEPIRIATEEDLHQAFLRVESRKVNKSGCISLHNEEWEVENGALLIGRRVQVLSDPAKPGEALVECEGFPILRAQRLMIGPHTAKRPKTRKPLEESAGSALLQGAVKRMAERRKQGDTDALKEPVRIEKQQSLEELLKTPERTDVLKFSTLRKSRE